MADLKKISDKLTHELNCFTDSQYSTINDDMKAMIIHTMDSAGLKEIDFTRGTGLASEGVWSYYGSIKISIVKMTWDGYKLIFYYYHAPDESRPEILRNMTYDSFVASGKKFVALQHIHDIICQISDVLDYLSKQNKEVTITLSNGIKVICNVSEDLTQKEALIDYIKPQMEDFSNLLGKAIENGKFTVEVKE